MVGSNHRGHGHFLAKNLTYHMPDDKWPSVVGVTHNLRCDDNLFEGITFVERAFIPDLADIRAKIIQGGQHHF